MQLSERNLEVRNLIGGAWEERDGRDTEPVYDPATGEVIAETPLSTAEDVDRAVKKAQEAFPGWSSTPVVERARLLFRFKALLEEHFEELRDLVTLENGKDAKDAGGEVRRGIEVVEFACGMPTLLMGETVRDVARGIDNASYRFPLGVVAAITPFNFPCMVPLWTLPIAIGAGNTYILKPSERTPLSAVRLGELLGEAGLPDGVFSIVNGAREAVDAILEHPGIKAVSFVGSQPVAEHVYIHGAAHKKRVQALAGAKNSMIAMPDAVLDKAVPNIISSAYGNAGERCLAGSVLVAVGSGQQQDRLVEAILAVSAAGPAASAPAYEEEYVSGEGPDRVAVVPVVGTIASADSTVPGTQPPATSEGLADALRQAADDQSVAAVVLEVNSPGGGVTASDEMHQSILDFKESSGKPVVVSMGDTAASGAYYISTAADKIVANETTLTGSLGVIFSLTNISELADKYGVKEEVVKSGKFKDMGSSFRELTPEEREILQSIVDESYDQFVEVIVKGRGLPEERVREIADGRVYSGEQARELGLVDSFGGLDEAAEVSEDLAVVDGATVVRYVQPESFTDALLSSFAPQKPEALQIAEEAGLTLEPKPYYLYLP